VNTCSVWPHPRFASPALWASQAVSSLARVCCHPRSRSPSAASHGFQRGVCFRPQYTCSPDDTRHRT
jgi:hypothetical protein